MAARPTTGARDDQCRPPLFTDEEWRRIVRELSLSTRQAQVVGLAIQSKKDKEIAKILHVKETTVYTHIKFAKLGFNAIDRVGLAYRVFECFRNLVEGRSSS